MLGGVIATRVPLRRATIRVGSEDELEKRRRPATALVHTVDDRRHPGANGWSPRPKSCFEPLSREAAKPWIGRCASTSEVLISR
jgi:hypothetical protein